MKKIKLKAAPRGRILSNNELKNIRGGKDTVSISCECVMETVKNGTDTRKPGGSADGSIEACVTACYNICNGYSGTSGDPDDCTYFSATYNVSVSGEA